MSSRLVHALGVATCRRLAAVLLLVPTGTVLVLASVLSPDPDGVGTHTQLGLTTCTLLLTTGWPCPMCGMTTTFTHLAHGQLVEGLLNQPFGLVLFLLTLAAAGLAFHELVWARGRLGQVFDWALQRDLRLAILGLVGLFGGWGYKILLMRGLLPWES